MHQELAVGSALTPSYVMNPVINPNLCRSQNLKLATMSAEIVVVPFPHPGHLFPATELCNQLAAKNHNVTVFYPSSSSPSSLSLHPRVKIVEFPSTIPSSSIAMSSTKPC